jgi:hypothetical protein
MEIPENVYHAMNDAEIAWNRVVAMAKANSGKWSNEQQEHLALFAQVMSGTHNALKRLLDANQT